MKTTFDYKILAHCDLAFDDLSEICRFKDSHWPYGLDSQISWMGHHHAASDLHFLYCENKKMLGYFYLAPGTVLLNGTSQNYYGLGCVLVAKQARGRGLGRSLVKRAVSFCEKNSTPLFLLCRRELSPFYSACDLFPVNCESVFVKDALFKEAVFSDVEMPDSLRVLEFSKAF